MSKPHSSIWARHNFIGGAAARCAGIQFQDSGGAHVVMANGDHVLCHGLAHDVDLYIGDEAFKVDCYSLGPILWDFDDLCMAFTYQGCRVLW